MSSLKSRVKSKPILTFSPDIELPLRHRCRNPRCRCKLQEPSDNLRNAFCCRGCFTGYFRSRCLVCEQPFERKQESQLTCSRPKCKAALRRDRARFFGKWGDQSGRGCQILGEAERRVGNPANTGIKTAHDPENASAKAKPATTWRQIAGPPMSSEALQLATIGAERITRLEQEQRAAVEAHLRASDPILEGQREASYVAAVKRFRDRGWGRPVTAPAVRAPAGCDWEPCKHPADEFPDIIPEFLRRRKESP